MKIDTKYLYELLPAYYRYLDSERQEPLKAFIEVLAREGGIVEESITQLYENWFIETCDECVVPYIGDLLGVGNIHEIKDDAVYSRRAYVANTLSYRRRKGTAPILEQLAWDITGWRSKVVEFFQVLATSQHVNHIRLQNKATPNIGKMNALDLVDTAFGQQSHTIDLRPTSKEQGKYHPQKLGLYLWRLQSYPLKGVNARRITSQGDVPEGCYTFSPLGTDMHLFNNPQTESDIAGRAKEIHVPGLLRRRALYDELENARKEAAVLQYFNEDYPPVFEVFINGNTKPVPPEEIIICNLQHWEAPPEQVSQQAEEAPQSTIAVDPVLGRLLFTDPEQELAEDSVLVNYNYGFSGDMGGGPYDRRASLKDLERVDIQWQAGVCKTHIAEHGGRLFDSLKEALEEWKGSGHEKKVGLITIMDNRSYGEKKLLNEEESLLIEIPEGKQLFIIAADWPALENPGDESGQKHRALGRFNPEDLRPHIVKNIEVKGKGGKSSVNGGALIINGLLIEGKIVVGSGLNHLSIQHCTLAPGNGGLHIDKQENPLQVSLEKSKCGPIDVTEAEGAAEVLFSIQDSIIDSKGGIAILAKQGQLAIQNSSVFGKVETRYLEASNCIFNDSIKITRRQIGCVRFCYLPAGSDTPRRYKCQPEQAGDGQEKALIEPFPIFNSKEYGHHAYGQLSHHTALSIRTGADNGSEMGAFNYLQQPQRETNLKIALEEYLRAGLETGIIYVN